MQTQETLTKSETDIQSPPDRTGLYLAISGMLAAMVMTAFMIAIRSFSETESLAEIMAGTVLEFMPISVFSFMLQLLKGLAKPILLGSVMVGMILVGGWIARFDGGPARDLSLFRKFRRVLVMTIAIWVPFAIFAVLITATGLAVSMSDRELISLAVILFADFFVYSLALYLLYPLVSGSWIRGPQGSEADHPPESLGRRKLLGQAGTAVVAAGGVLYLGGFLRDIRAGSIGGDGDKISLPVTPNDEFYTVSKNFIDPRVDSDGWELEITGLVQQPVKISYDELLAMPSVEQMSTLTCISNEVGGDLIDNALWTGVKLSDLIAKAGILAAPGKVAFFGHDGYNDSFEFSKALEETTIVAYLMNGERLPNSHGFPARLIVPGKYGIKNGKWLRRIQLVDSHRGYWQERGWTDVANIKTMSRFDIPGSRAILPFEPLDIGGVAFAGERGIARVEYSTDDGETWQDADELNVVASLSWAIWKATWTPTSTGTYRLRVRATDGEGNVQTTDKADPEPDGASGHHRIVIGVT